MRKVQKQEVLEMIQTLHQAHDEVKNYIDRKNYVLAQDILSQCQECAISIGTLIEKIEGERFVTVSYVENYCDVLFSIYEELNGNDANANKAYKNLKKQLLRIENSVKNDVPVRKEIAFFPYKASMWDALESVYLAAKEDPDCDAYCVPIPYYDRNPDRSLGQMHYEGGEYPKNIEVIDWQTYNFEERKPDIAYIHNPYDDWNLVTCVHPRYFSANLKKYTEKLVYIPYFVLDEIEPTDQASIDGMKHFCFLPGVVNADKVIVQSEKMKQIYVNEYLKAAKTHGLGGYHLDRKKLEEKFLGLGSPKFDKVLNTKKEDLEIPEEWLKIIEKPDGSWKKIIFYNTSIAALLEHNEKMQEKMKWVFDIFKKNKDEVALLWRPHPLIKSTVSSMRPQLWMEYEKLVNQYRQEGWGIYDDSSDMDRAVVLSDAYYGDVSSVVQVYLKTGKVVMIQNAEWIGNRAANKMFRKYTWCDVGDEIWFPGANINGLFVYHKKTKETKYISKLLDGKADDMCGILGMIQNDNKFYILPYLSEQILIYDLNNGLEKKINIGKKALLKQAVIYKEKKCMYLFGDGDSYKLDMETQVVHAIVNSFADKNSGLGAMVFGDKPCVVGNAVFYPAAMGDAVLEFDMEQERFILHELQKRNNRYNTILFYGNDFWLSGNQKQIIRWNKENKEEEIFAAFPEDFALRNEKDTFLFTISIALGNEIFFMPWNANMLLKMDLVEHKLKKVKCFPQNVMCWFAKKWDDNHIYTEICNENYGVLKESVIIDIEGEKIEEDVFAISKDLLTECKVGITEGVIQENNFRDLKDILNDERVTNE
ncbi:MAG: hypothetical protein UHN47_16575 [Lachnospiraceae bacterium]|nr:hypothetical protein [Lachnospiraceae bacterium]